ncbi:MAG: Gfo/Idh/MocA family oxidoreductase [Candidatus Bathyarchaeota archaeon]|nr:MAG: Gfo/Idh/MocA family oxidoreductase [Candidatus Bathyarchaeota archaeon]
MKLKVGVVGAGFITKELHLPVWTNLRDVHVTAVCDKNTSLAKEVSSRFGIKHVFSDVTDMLTKEKLDLVDICTPPKTHSFLSIQAMEAGCNVLVEKPMAVSVREAKEMVDTSKKYGVRLCVVHQNLFNPAVMRARRMVEGGVIGKLLNVDVRTFESKMSAMCLNRNHWCHTLLGGIFCEILPHPIYLLQVFLREADPVHVLSEKLGDRDWMKKDELMVSVEAQNGLGSLGVSCNSLVHGDTFDILGTEMALRGDIWGRTVITYKPHTQSPLSVGKSNLHVGLQSFKVMGTTASTVLSMIRGVIRARAHYTFISKLVDSIRNNKKAPTTAEDGLETVEFLEAVCKKI